MLQKYRDWKIWASGKDLIPLLPEVKETTLAQWDEWGSSNKDHIFGLVLSHLHTTLFSYQQLYLVIVY